MQNMHPELHHNITHIVLGKTRALTGASGFQPVGACGLLWLLVHLTGCCVCGAPSTLECWTDPSTPVRVTHLVVLSSLPVDVERASLRDVDATVDPVGGRHRRARVHSVYRQSQTSEEPGQRAFSFQLCSRVSMHCVSRTRDQDPCMCVRQTNVWFVTLGT